MSSVTLNVEETIENFASKVTVAIPPEKPTIKGHLTVNYKIKSKPEVQALFEAGGDDFETFDEIVHSVEGLGNANGPLTGDAALKEAKEGRYSMYLVAAIVQQYFEQYGLARQGNSRKRR